MAEEEQRFVARMPELAQLELMLERALQRQGTVSFIAGAAGTGKTALSEAFSQRALAAHDDLIVAVGQCDANTGGTNPYLPFREVMNLLMGDFESKVEQGAISAENAKRLARLLSVSVDVLVENGPDLIGLLVGAALGPGGLVASKIGKTLLQKTEVGQRLGKRVERPSVADLVNRSDIDQSQILEQATTVLRRLSDHQPLLIIVDDLHWADSASIALLFRLGRRLEGSRIMLVGTYRPEELGPHSGQERHPLDKLVTEFRRYFGEISVDLDQAVRSRGREFIDTYLNTTPNALDESFRQALFRHTGGQPLFTIELLQDLRERSALVLNEDDVLVANLNLNWDTLPARAEGVIKERLARLPEDIHENLTVAAVQGDHFAAEVIAAVQSQEVRPLIRSLSEQLQREHKLIESIEVERLGRQRISRYRFTNRIVQTYLYERMDDIERSYLHEDVGRALEELYGDHADLIAPTLARHFEIADLPDKAAHYYERAAENAAASYANAEAAFLFGKALELVDETDVRWRLLLGRERGYNMLGATQKQRADLDALDELAAGDPARHSEIALRRASHLSTTGDFAQAAEIAGRAVEWAVEAGDKVAEAAARHRQGRAYWQLEDYTAAREHLVAALDLARKAESIPIEAKCLYDLSTIDYFESEYSAAQERLEVAIPLFRQVGDKRGELRCHSLYGVLLDISWNRDDARARFDEALRLAREIGWRYAELRALLQAGVSLLQLGRFEEAREHFDSALIILSDTEDQQARAMAHDNLGQVYYFLDEPDTAFTHYMEALAIHRARNDRRGLGFVLTNLGILALATDKLDDAIAHLHEALALRQSVGGNGLVVDTLAALAAAEVARGNTTAALEAVEQARQHISMHGISSINEPVLVYWLLAQSSAKLAATDPVLADVAVSFRKAGRELLEHQADLIEDSEMREQFLQRLPHNRKLLAT